MNPHLPEERLPVTLLTGFLGSGKTTLLAQLLKRPELADTAVIINEFGEVGLDHLLVEASSEQTVLLDSGCLCCTVRGDLVNALRSLLIRRAKGELPAFRRIVIETTGLADPAPILHTLMNEPVLIEALRLDGILVAIDAVNADAQFDSHREAVKQAAVADRLILTKADLVDGAGIARIETRLRRLNPAAPILRAMRGEIEPGAILGCGLFDPTKKDPDVAGWLQAEAFAAADPDQDRSHGSHGAHDHAHDHAHEHDHGDAALDRNRHDDRIRALCLTAESPLDWPQLVAWIEGLIAAHGESLLRIKGILDLEGSTQPVAIHGVQHLFHPPARLPAWPQGPRRSQIVFILRDLPESLLREGFARLAGGS